MVHVRVWFRVLGLRFIGFRVKGFEFIKVLGVRISGLPFDRCSPSQKTTPAPSPRFGSAGNSLPEAGGGRSCRGLRGNSR